ncbi:hypothetical protein BROSI_A2873 [Candidatus Brocadia sinica JPN1]|uniref:Uncharacterized protein n=1 Tax=Candidatus Brocadia sinica JPN1 TaxID=1197129 RepID=A0ABQ0JZX6_9BACT|nr:hypothetical protein BROSI_A2873 [Candidatus Brocadia sinica JPN1]
MVDYRRKHLAFQGFCMEHEIGAVVVMYPGAM